MVVVGKKRHPLRKNRSERGGQNKKRIGAFCESSTSRDERGRRRKLYARNNTKSRSDRGCLARGDIEKGETNPLA